MSTFKAPVASTPHAWMIKDIQTIDESLKVKTGTRNEEFLELYIHAPDQYELYADEFEAPLPPPDAFEAGKWDSLREDLDFFRRENDFDRN